LANVKCASTAYEYKAATAGTTAVTDAAITGWSNTCCTIIENPKTCVGLRQTEAWARCPTNFYGAWDVKTKTDGTCTIATTDDTDAKKKKKFQASCCVEKKKCSDHHCDASKARISDHNKDQQYCLEAHSDYNFRDESAQRFLGGLVVSREDCDVKCCKNDPTTCRGYDAPQAGGDHNEWGCWPADQFFLDAGEIAIWDTDGNLMKHANGTYMLQLMPKTTNKVEMDEDYKAQCCTPKLVCENWKDPSVANYPAPYVKPKAQTSAAKRQEALVAAPLLVAFGVIALSKRAQIM
jgi:hypothetical protein